MKKSKIKKILNKLIEEDKKCRSKISESYNNKKFAEITEDEKNKIDKLTLGIIRKEKDDIQSLNSIVSIDYYDDRISITSELNGKFTNITVIKDIGVILEVSSYSNKTLSCYFRYNDFYNKILPEVSKKLLQLNKDNLDEIYSDLMKQYKILRESNIDLILDHSSADLSEL